MVVVRGDGVDGVGGGDAGDGLTYVSIMVQVCLMYVSLLSY